MQQYEIKADHPIFKRINWIADGINDLHQKIEKLKDAGYEITVDGKKIN